MSIEKKDRPIEEYRQSPPLHLEQDEKFDMTLNVVDCFGKVVGYFTLEQADLAGMWAKSRKAR